MKIDYRNESYDAPEGAYRVVLVDQIDFEPEFKKDVDIRLRFKVLHPSDDTLIYLVGKNYSIKNSVLNDDLKSWFPQGLAQFQEERGKVDLKKLIGQEADIIVSHKISKAHEKPFVSIQKIYPPGKLVKFSSN